MGLPLVPLVSHGPAKGWQMGLSLILMAIGSVMLCLHGGISDLMSVDLDAGDLLGKEALNAMLGIFLSVIAIPICLFLICIKPPASLALYILFPALLGAGSQVLFFGWIRVLGSASGIDLWVWPRTAIHFATGFTAGMLTGAFALYRPRLDWTAFAGVSEFVGRYLPRPIHLSIFMSTSLALIGAWRIAVERRDTVRFIEVRLDDYFLSLSNLRRAQMEDLAYPELTDDLNRARRALIGAAAFDPGLVKRLGPLIHQIERIDPTGESATDFKNATLSLNRHLLSLGEPYFLEPHIIRQGTAMYRILLRYRVSTRTRCRVANSGSVPILRLRRMDNILIDTPYVGLSYPGIGTVLMDHIEDDALRSYGPLFSPAAKNKHPEDGRFTATRQLMRADRRAALISAMQRRGLEDTAALERLASMAQRWSQVVDISGARTEMDLPTRSVYDALCDILARQTELHEARHATDGEWTHTIEAVNELSPGTLGPSASAEIRSMLTEIVDGDLGPGFALSNLMELIAGKDARSNAYFFATAVILEHLWGQKIRRPDIVEKDTANGTAPAFAPISRKYPGWLSYSRIHGAYADLRAMAPEALRAQARFVFETLFNEDYQPITRYR